MILRLISLLIKQNWINFASFETTPVKFCSFFDIFRTVYGQPEVIGDYCKPCNCSGNIDVNDPQACDSVSGECLRCLNNAYGPACGLCAPGFFGDAVAVKDCQRCHCDECGTSQCSSYTGEW